MTYSITSSNIRIYQQIRKIMFSIRKNGILNTFRPSNLHALCVFFSHFFFFFFNHTSQTHTSLMTSFTHFRENLYIMCSNIISYLANLVTPAAIVQTTIESNPWKKRTYLPTYEDISSGTQSVIS